MLSYISLNFRNLVKIKEMSSIFRSIQSNSHETIKIDGKERWILQKFDQFDFRKKLIGLTENHLCYYQPKISNPKQIRIKA